MRQFKELSEFFEEQVKKGIFTEEKPKEPFYTYVDVRNPNALPVLWYTTKWYRCKACGNLIIQILKKLMVL